MGVFNVQKRRKRVVDSVFQYRMVALFLSVVLAGFVLCSVGFFLYYWIPEAVQSHGQSGTGAQNAVAVPAVDDNGISQWELVLPPLLINNLLIMIFVIIVGLGISHRIAGPIRRMQKDIRRALAGEKGVRVHVRKKDSFPDLAGEINLLLERIESTRE